MENCFTHPIVISLIILISVTSFFAFNLNLYLIRWYLMFENNHERLCRNNYHYYVDNCIPTVDEYKLPLGKYKCKNPNCKKKIHVTIFPSSESSLRVDILKKSKYDS